MITFRRSTTPKNGCFYENYLEHRTGLVALESGDTTVFTYEKEEKHKYNCHLTVKPVALLRRLLEIFTAEGQHVLDPFLGSGSTAVACAAVGRRVTGIEIRDDYMRIAEQRLKEVLGEKHCG